MPMITSVDLNGRRQGERIEINTCFVKEVSEDSVSLSVIFFSFSGSFSSRCTISMLALMVG